MRNGRNLDRSARARGGPSWARKMMKVGTPGESQWRRRGAYRMRPGGVAAARKPPRNDARSSEVESRATASHAATGDVAPLRTIAGPLTTLSFPGGVAVTDDEIVVCEAS